MRAHAPVMGRRFALAGLALLAGCGGSQALPARSTPSPVAEAPGRPTAAAPAKPPHRILRFRASDGHRLRGRLTAAERPRAPGVVLVHGLYGEPSQWDAFVGHLHRAGFATLAYASRRDDEVNETVLARDLTGAVRALRARPEVDRDRIVLAGASVGGLAVAYALATQPDLPALGGVGFSALEGPREAALARRHAFRPHDLLLISDHREAHNARSLRADAHGKGVTTYFTETTGHGIRLLADPGVRARAIGWLKRLTT